MNSAASASMSSLQYRADRLADQIDRLAGALHLQQVGYCRLGEAIGLVSFGECLAVRTEDLADGFHIYETAPATLNPHHSAGRSLGDHRDQSWRRERTGVTHLIIARRRQYLAIFATIWISLIVAIAASVHIRFSDSPLWMATMVGLPPALLVTDGCMTVADRRGWLRPASRDQENNDDDTTTPRWIAWFGGLVLAGLGSWFGEPWYDSWHHLYPAAPAWMVFVTILELAVLGIAIVEVVLAKIIIEIRNKRRSVVHD